MSRPTQSSEEAGLELAGLDTCAASDALDALGLEGVALGLARLSTEKRVAGRVITVALRENDGQPARRHLGTAAIESASLGDVIVVAHNGRTEVAGWGGLLCLGASLRGVAGIVIDGALRDLDEARELGLPIFGRSAVPRTARGRIVEEAWNVPVTICGIAVVPGDYVIADASGVVFIPNARAVEVVAAAGRIVSREASMARALHAGEAISQVMGRSYEAMIGHVGK